MTATKLRALGRQRQLDSVFWKEGKLGAETGPKEERHVKRGSYVTARWVEITT